MDFKLIQCNTDLKKLQEDGIMRQLPWDYAVISRAGEITPYKVYRIEGYKHTEGGRWGQNCYWCCPRNEEPSYDNLIEFDSDDVCLFGVQADPVSNMRYKWDEKQVDSGWVFKITRNGSQFHKFYYGDLLKGLIKAQQLLEEIQDSPFAVFNYDWQSDWIGKPVWYGDCPAKIEKFREGYFEVFLVPDGIPEFPIPNSWKDDGILKESWEEYKHGIWVECTDQRIYWFRDEKYIN